MKGSKIIKNPFLRILKIQDRMFQIKKILPESKINEVEDWVSLLKQYYCVDTILKANGQIWMCNEIQTISYEEI